MKMVQFGRMLDRYIEMHVDEKQKLECLEPFREWLVTVAKGDNEPPCMLFFLPDGTTEMMRCDLPEDE